MSGNKLQANKIIIIIIKASKVKLSRYMPWKHIGERRYSSHSYLTSALDGV
jgi:hypothetical protein